MKTMTILAATMMLAGCAADESSEDDGSLGTTTEAFSVTTSRVSVDYHGGTGGTADRISCAPGDIAVGFYGTHGTYVDALGLVCAPVRSGGALGARYKTGTRGGVGPVSFMFLCPTGNALSGFYGRAATYLDAIGGVCWNVAARSYASGVGKFYGGTGGQVFLDDDCPRDYAVSSLYLRAANWVDALRGTCSYIAP